ncbi:MAG TPA: hypothetical protein VGC06_20170 [Actinomycetes bacterium]
MLDETTFWCRDCGALIAVTVYRVTPRRQPRLTPHRLACGHSPPRDGAGDTGLVTAASPALEQEGALAEAVSGRPSAGEERDR